ncbi:suppressor of SWI4 1 homolog isoform X2 [Serinus canaria]|uniref:suppressor of SWI4 1 homolog isoform X2 n=1 Tax=Serinus canaria TaxID=9135 RepID=UPI0021CCB03D|nr:suppressor of SWI4 1 homolog isoform X2 [Serinus canaria]
MGRPGKSRFQRQQRAEARQRSEQEFGSVPHSFVFARGRPGRSLRSLCRDLRRVLEPYTARSLQVRRSNSLRDLLAVAGPLGVTQFLALSKSQSGINLKLFRLPGGPTLTFKVLQYSLVRDVVSALRRHRMHEQQFLHPPLLVLGNFGVQGGPELRLTAGMFQGMLPTLNVHRVNLNSIRRCLLISYEAEARLLQLRHYVQVVPVGLSRGIRKILQEKFPDLGRMDDVSQLLTGDAVLSESEAEPDGSQNVLELPQNCAGRGNAATQQSAIRLTEIGPRLTLQLLKVEEGLGQGNVLYHGLAPKGEEELRQLQVRRERRLQVRAERRRQQEQNLERKRQQRERHRERSLAGMGRAPGGPTGDTPGGPSGDTGGDSDVEDPGAPEAGEAEASDEDEAEYYRQELGEEPDTDLFPSSSKRKRSPSAAPRARKRRKRSPKSPPGSPKFTAGTPKSHPGTQKSHPGHPKNPKSHPGNPKFRPGSPKSQRGTPKSHPGSQNFTPGTPKSHPGHPKNPKSHPRKAGTPKSQPGTSKSHPGHPKNPKSHPGHPKNPKSQRGKLLSPRKIPNFPRPGRARKRKN